MQYTGITRRIDELGRVVIPKEIRRTMRLREGEEMEIFVDENSLILKKYSCVKGIQKFSEEIAESLFSSTGDTSLVTDLDKIVAAAGFDKTFYSDKLLLQKVAEIFQKRTTRTVFLPDGYAITGDDTNEYKMQIFAPVIVAGDVTGGVILLSKSEKNVAEKPNLPSFRQKSWQIHCNEKAYYGGERRAAFGVFHNCKGNKRAVSSAAHVCARSGRYGNVSACIFHLRADTCADYGRNPRCGVKAHERE